MSEEIKKEFEEWCKQQWFVNLETKNDVYNLYLVSNIILQMTFQYKVRIFSTHSRNKNKS